MFDPDHAAILRRGKSVWNRWRKENPEIAPNLSELKLRIIFQFDEEAHLGGYNFRDTRFEGAYLEGFVFYDGDELEKTILSGANFSGAHLRGAHLRYTDLNGADFTGAEMGYTIIGDTNLSRTKGLAEVMHHSPSSIDVDTIEDTYRDLKLAARYPSLYAEWGMPTNQQESVETFLLNAGTPSHLIEYYSRMEPSREYHSCFISYSHSDKEFAQYLHRRLQHLGAQCWLDEHQVLPGDDLLDSIDRGIRLWDKVLLCCSKASLESWWVDKEIEKALAKEQEIWATSGKKVLSIIPLNLDGFVLNGWVSGKASLIRSRSVADFTNWRDNSAFERQIFKLEQALRKDREPGGHPL